MNIRVQGAWQESQRISWLGNSWMRRGSLRAYKSYWQRIPVSLDPNATIVQKKTRAFAEDQQRLWKRRPINDTGNLTRAKKHTRIEPKCKPK